MQYRHTFYSTETGAQMTRKLFLEGKDDSEKSYLIGCNENHWSTIKDKVAAWMTEGWERWEEEKPEWFTDKWKASVPEDMKPTKKTGDVDGEDKTATKNEGEETLTVGGGEEQKGRRRSVLELISGQKAASSKVMPAEGIKKEIDEEEFLREMNRRGSMIM